MKSVFDTKIAKNKVQRLRDVWRRVLAYVVIVCAVAGVSMAAASTLHEQCFANEGVDAQEACHFYVEAIRSNLSRIVNLCRDLENRSLLENAIVVCKQGLRHYPNSRELQNILQSAQHGQKNSSSAGSVGKTSNRAARLAKIACLRLQVDRALDPCQRATRLNPQDAALAQRLGDVLSALGRGAEAEQAYQTARQLGLANAGPTVSAQAAQPKQTASAKPPEKTAPLNAAAVAAPNEKASDASLAGKSKTLLAQLQLLERLQKEGLISEKEHKERKAKLLDVVFQAQPIADPERTTPKQNAPTQPKPRKGDLKLVQDLKLGKFYALVIGNNDYQNIPKLESAIIDAKAVGTLLEKEYGFHVTQLIDANRYQILSELSRFRTVLTERDSFLVYYAGHGILDDDIQRGYWLPVDAEANNFANWLSTTEVVDHVNGMKALHVMVVADSCFSGALVRGVRPVFGRSSDREKADHHALIRRLAKKRSRTVLTSGGLEPVLDSGGGIHSVFAKAFLNTLSDNEGIMEGTKFFQKLRELVVYNADQTPEYAPARKAGHEGGDFIFIRKP